MMKTILRRIGETVARALLTLPLLLAQPALAATPVEPDTPLFSAPRFTLVTVAPGRAAHALFGHSAIRMIDAERGLDWLFNYGTFDFTPLFVPQFAYGDLTYWLGVSETDAAFAYYRTVERRPVHEQTLLLEQRHARQLAELLLRNAQPDRREYTYDFFRDNCSTRITDILYQATDSTLHLSNETRSTGPNHSFRDALLPYTQRAPLLGFGIHLVLGMPTDMSMDVSTQDFLPDALSSQLAQMHVTWNDGVSRPITVDPASVPPGPVRHFFSSGLFWFFTLIGALLAIVQRYPWAATLAARLVWITVGLCGLVLFGMGLLSQHTVIAPNWNWAWAWPTHLLLLIPTFEQRWGRAYRLTWAGATSIFILSAPFLPQYVAPSLIPLLVGMVIRSVRQQSGLPPRS